MSEAAVLEAPAPAAVPAPALESKATPPVEQAAALPNLRRRSWFAHAMKPSPHPNASAARAEIKSLRIRNGQELDQARAAKLEWTTLSTDLLNNLFDSPTVAEQCNDWVGPHLSGVRGVRQFRRTVFTRKWTIELAGSRAC